MGCDIHSFAERCNKETGKWQIVTDVVTFDNRDYSVFAFLAGVRNYDHCEPISEPKGLPDDVCDEIQENFESWQDDAHSASFLTVKELLDFDYEKQFWNRRISRTTHYPEGGSYTDGAAIAEEGEGEILSYRQNLGGYFFEILKELSELGDTRDTRVVFWFDN